MRLTPQLIAALTKLLAPELRGSPSLCQQLATRLRSAATALDCAEQPQLSQDGLGGLSIADTPPQPQQQAHTISTQQDDASPSGVAVQNTKKLRRTKCMTGSMRMISPQLRWCR